MKVHLPNYMKHSRITNFLLTSLIVIILFSGCAKEASPDSVICNLDDYSTYPEVVEQILPTFSIEQLDKGAYYTLDGGAITEAFDTQAAGALETGIAKYWYPHYLATVIIAIDRDQTNTIVKGWNDLFVTQQEVGLFGMPGNMQMLAAAMSYGLEGENYSLKTTIQLLTSLHKKSRLKTNTFGTPIIICYDYQAADLIENGRNIEIIIPIEGTLVYEKGLLSNEKLNFQDNVDKLLLEAKLRLLDGQSNPSIYPDETAYASAIGVSDYKHFAKTIQNANPLIERNVLRTRLLMSIDNREHLYFALIYIIIVTIWTVSFMRRSMQKGISYSAFFVGIILNGWTLVRLIKYQIEGVPALTRYLWYAFYIFQLMLPLVMLWMAWAIDKPKDKILPPKWWRILAILITFLIILVFTNDIHGHVLQLDLSRLDWDIEYSYGYGYYIILFVCMMNLIGVFVILMKKSMKSPRKKGFIIPLILFFMFGLYNYKYIIRDPFVYKTDLTIVTGLFTMLMFEACIRSGLIPVNTKYIDLFTRSPLKLQIANKKGEMILTSASSTLINKDTLDKVLESSPVPIYKDEGSLLFANPIPGGYAIWQEDISKLYQLHREIKESTQMLMEANAILAEEEKLKRIINEKDAKKDLMDQLEAEIAESIEQMSVMIEELPQSKSHIKETTQIALLLCYIKRRCNLFFKEMGTNTMVIDELIVYIDELSEIARYSNVQIATVNQIKGCFAIRYATLFYDFFYEVTDWAIQTGCPYMIEHLGYEEEFLTMGFLTSEEMGIIKLGPRLIAAISDAKGKIIKKDLEDTMSISISFPKGGVVYD
ncbi:MAG TPA: histidine kinase N-terminal 7TM domain-containing protein [Thermoclostridium sp.]|nr:histidine kinase N-terminal 7TM domain-containing protein [Thermoclostridium sp.]